MTETLRPGEAEVREWATNKGLSWEITEYPNGDFVRINWGVVTERVGRDFRDHYEGFWVSELKDGEWPIERPATTQEIQNFALVALRQMPNSSLAKDLARQAALLLRKEGETLIKKAERIEEKLGLRD